MGVRESIWALRPRSGELVTADSWSAAHARVRGLRALAMNCSTAGFRGLPLVLYHIPTASSMAWPLGRIMRSGSSDNHVSECGGAPWRELAVVMDRYSPRVPAEPP